MVKKKKFLLPYYLLYPMFHAVYQNLIFFSCTFQLILSMFLEQSIILCQNHLTPKILVKHALCVIISCTNGASNVFINSSK